MDKLKIRSQAQCALQRFAWFDSLHPCQLFFSHVETGLPGLNQYSAADKVSCLRKQHSEIASGECLKEYVSLLGGIEYLLFYKWMIQ